MMVVVNRSEIVVTHHHPNIKTGLYTTTTTMTETQRIIEPSSSVVKKSYVGIGVDEDDEDEISNIRLCDYLDEKFKPEPYDYQAHFNKWKYAEETKIFQFILDKVQTSFHNTQTLKGIKISLGKNNAEISDEQVKMSIISRYGPFDIEESREMFNYYKTELITEYETWIKRANKIIQRMYKEAEVNQSKEPNLDRILKKLTQVLAPIKPAYLNFTSFTSKNPQIDETLVENEIEPFCLQRPSYYNLMIGNIERVRKVKSQELGFRHWKIKFSFF